MSLGPVEGVPLIGRPLDVSVRVLLDPGTDIATLCARAEVMQGDVQTVGATARLEALSGQQAILRVRTTRNVEEPIVTIVAHIGCQMPASRRFVLLADLPAEPQQAPMQLATTLSPRVVPVPPAASDRAFGPPTRTQSASQPGRPRTAPAEGPVPSVVRRTDRAPTLVRPQAAAPAAPIASAAAPRQSVVLKQQRPAAAGPTSRLRLDPLDLTVEAEPTLKLTQTIGPLAQVTPAQRAEAAAALRALNTPPAELQRLFTMESELKSMRTQMQANKADVLAMRAQLQKAEQDRNRIAWGLSALVLALFALLLAALFWRRRELFPNQSPAWWRDSKFGPDANEKAASAERAMDETQRLPRQAAGQEAPLDLDLSLLGSEKTASEAPDSASGPISAFSHLDFQSSQPASWRSLKTEELHDIQEQADFFVSLGDYDRAVNVLMSHVQASPQTSALAWMALLDLHHRLQRRQGYEGLREQIQRRMNVNVPPFDTYRNATAGLEDYAEALDRIQALWPLSRVLDVIEEYIYRMAGTTIVQPFELAAFHDLLLLYNIGKSIVDETEVHDIGIDQTADAGDEFPMTTVAPLSADLQGPSEEDVLLFATLLAGGRVDVNLEDSDEPDAARITDDPTVALPGAKAPGNLIDFDDFDAATDRVAPRQKNYPR